MAISKLFHKAVHLTQNDGIALVKVAINNSFFSLINIQC
jgi:hypothetical protein